MMMGLGGWHVRGVMGNVAVGREDFWLVSTLARVYFQR